MFASCPCDNVKKRKDSPVSGSGDKKRGKEEEKERENRQGMREKRRENRKEKTPGCLSFSTRRYIYPENGRGTGTGRRSGSALWSL